MREAYWLTGVRSVGIIARPPAKHLGVWDFRAAAFCVAAKLLAGDVAESQVADGFEVWRMGFFALIEFGSCARLRNICE